MSQLPVSFDSSEKIWSGPRDRGSIYKDDVSFGTIIFNTMSNWPKNVCQISADDGTTLTFEQTLTWAIRVAQFFKKRGLNHKDVIGIVGLNSTYLRPLAVACLMNGTPFHAVNTKMDEATTKVLFSRTKPSIIFCDGNVYQKIRSSTSEWKPEFYLLTGKVEEVRSIEVLLEPTETERFYQPEPLVEGGKQTAVILCSSGTTGLPKPICVSNQALITSMPINNELVVYTPSSLDYYSGLFAFTLSGLQGVTLVSSNKPFLPKNFVEMVKKYKINSFVLPPRHLSDLISSPEISSEGLESVMNCGYSGSSVSQAALQRVRKIFPRAALTSSYGLTECGLIATNYTNKNFSSAGIPLPGVKIRIVDEFGQNLTHNQVGEIYANTGRPWNGYYGDPKETSRMQDSEGWFHTGDLGYFDSENFLYIVDRKKEVLKYQGLQFWTSEIEDVISELPQVRHVCVVGIYNERHGDEAGALVVANKESNLLAKDIVKHVAMRLPAIQKQLHAGVQFTNSLPMNPNGKTIRKAARDAFLAKKLQKSG
ncbi:probable CoA ligase CCL7 [Drosophila ficusphila]|uniref:probable CoA ligase CCL7 n=1 Tax=Drosophila ficusphila TaxID=30025 RepID=UPI0007E83149|nr:probable CoA ligase CCL7 [Drosophila ficusphila]